MNRILKTSGLVALFFASFFFFLYLTFPYEVLKESIASSLSDAMEMEVRIGELEPKFLRIGVTFKDVTLKEVGSPEIKFKSLGASIGVLPLLLGDIGANLEAHVTDKDFLEINASLGIFGVLKQQYLPRSVVVKSEKFPIGSFISFFLKGQANSPSANPLVAPLLKEIEFLAELEADIDIDLDKSEPTQSSGDLSVNFNKAVLRITDPSLNIPDQNFSKAIIKANISNAKMTVDKDSGFVSNDLAIDYSGDITLKSQIHRSSMNMSAKVTLSGPLKDQFGFIMDAITGTQSDGAISLKIAGTVGNPNVKTF